MNIVYSTTHTNGWTGFDKALSAGTDITITAIPGDGYEFSEWSNGQTANPITFKLNSNVDITATFIASDD